MIPKSRTTEGRRIGGLEPSAAAKANERLRRVLEEAEPASHVRAIMVLGSGAPLPNPNATPRDFPSWKEYRQAVIAHQKRAVEADLGDAISALEALDLRLQGGEISRTVVVEGPAAAIARSLELPSVLSASLDEKHRLIP